MLKSRSFCGLLTLLRACNYAPETHLLSCLGQGACMCGAGCELFQQHISAVVAFSCVQQSSVAEILVSLSSFVRICSKKNSQTSTTGVVERS